MNQRAEDTNDSVLAQASIAYVTYSLAQGLPNATCIRILAGSAIIDATVRPAVSKPDPKSSV